MRILHVVRPASGGMRRHVVNLVQHLNTADIAHSIAAPGQFMAALPANLALQRRITLEIAPNFGMGDIGIANKLKAEAGDRFDVVHAHGLRAAYITAMACGLGKLNWIYTAHNLIPNGGMARMGLSLVGSKASAIIAVSPAVKKSLLACGVDGHTIRVVPNGVDIGYFSQMPANSRKILGLDPNAFVIGCVARLSPEKGVDILLDAVARIPNVTVIVAGDGPEKAKLLGSAPDNVKFLGQVEDVRSVYGASDLIVIPSREEGQGIVALEAMAAGLPVIASNVGGLSSMYTGTDGAHVVPPDDEHALASGIKRMIGDEDMRRRFAANGRDLVKEYDIKTTVTKLYDLYRAVMR